MDSKMDDKTRILMTVIRDLCFTMVLGFKKEGVWLGGDGEEKPQFLSDYMRKPKPGDLVLCKTSHISDWKVSFFVEEMPARQYLLREIGSDRLCQMGNESLEVFVPLNGCDLLEGWRHKIYVWALGKAFSERYNPKADYLLRCGGVDFMGDEGDEIARIFIRRKFEIGVPLKYIDMKVSKKTRLKDIVKALIDGKFGEESNGLKDDRGDSSAD